MCSSEPTTVEKLRGLPWSLASNAALAIFVQLTVFGPIFVLFLDELGLSKSQIGFLLSFLPFTGLLAPLIAPAVARFGYKRTALLFFGARNVFVALLLLTPWTLRRFGFQVTLAFIAGLMALFALFRTIGVMGRLPWVQEFVPNTLRGKYTATNNIFSTLAGLLAVTGAGYLLKHTSGLTAYTWLFGAGVLFGLLSVWLAWFIPGGAPARQEPARRGRRHLRAALRDRDFIRYLVGVGCVTLATVPLVSFLPLFMQDEVGLSPANVVILQTGTQVGGLVSSYLWGWAADRYGSRPVALYGALITALLPIFWMLMPRHSTWSLTIALSIAFFQGLASVGWSVGSNRLLFVSVVPTAQRADYMALYWAWFGLVGGISQLLGGQILDLSQGIQGRFYLFTVDPYISLFILGLILPLIAILALRSIRDDHTIGMGRFASIFLRGNPLLAMESVLRFHRARDEHSVVLVTERLGQAKSPLTEDELLEALADPRFNVRFEALISIGRMRPDEPLIEALVEVLEGSNPALSVMAAWALGRMGDQRAVSPLRRALLSSRYRSVKAHSSRSLGALGDREIADLLLEQLKEESDQGLRVAYASALGQLEVEEAVGPLLTLLRFSQDQPSRMEIALALARIVGNEHRFVQLLRQARRDLGTTTAQAVLSLRKEFNSADQGSERVSSLLEECATALAHHDLDDGLVLLSHCLHLWPKSRLTASQQPIIRHCARELEVAGAARLEYAILGLHTLQMSCMSQ